MNKYVALKSLIEACLAKKKNKFLWLERVLVISMKSIWNEK